MKDSTGSSIPEVTVSAAARLQHSPAQKSDHQNSRPAQSTLEPPARNSYHARPISTTCRPKQTIKTILRSSSLATAILLAHVPSESMVKRSARHDACLVLPSRATKHSPSKFCPMMVRLLVCAGNSPQRSKTVTQSSKSKRPQILSYQKGANQADEISWSHCLIY